MAVQSTLTYDYYSVSVSGSPPTVTAVAPSFVDDAQRLLNAPPLLDTATPAFQVAGTHFQFDADVSWAGGDGFLAQATADNPTLGIHAGDTFIFVIHGSGGPSIPLTSDNPNGTWDPNTGCFYAGTMIATPDGERAVETLRAGDLVLTVGGAAHAVRWLGSTVVSRVFADPLRVLPIRIAAGALGEQLPARDLMLSPDHALLLDGVLVQASALVNGSTITRDLSVPGTFHYYHVELDTHSVLLAEGAPAESYLDGVEQIRFTNAAERPARNAPVEALAYPRVKSARQVPLAVRELVSGRVMALLSSRSVAA